MSKRIAHVEALESRSYLSAAWVAAPADVGAASITTTLSGTLPRTVVSGQRIKPIVQKLTMTELAGAGQSTLTGTATINLSLSIDPTANPDDVQLGTITRKINLKPGKSTTVPIRVTGIPALTSGTLYLLADVTAPNGTSSTAVSAGTIDVSPPIIDLSGQFLATPASAHIGSPAKLTFGIANGGNVAAAGTLTINVVGNTDPSLNPASNVPLGTITHHINIKPGGALKFSFAGKVPSVPTGAYYLIATLDPANVFSDINQFNNTFISSGTTTIA